MTYFPEQDLPQTLSEENLGYYSSENHVLPPDLIRHFLIYEHTEDDEYVEYVPCFKIKNTENWHAVIYWRAELLNYNFVLACYNKNGILLAKQVLAGINSDGKNLLKSIATIDEDWVIKVIIGEQSEGEYLYDTNKSFITSYELMADGSIISQQEEA